MALVAFVFCCAVQAQAPTRAQIEATFLFKFLEYVEWPATSVSSPESPYIIGVLGSDPIATAVEQTVTGEQIRGHHIEARRFVDASHIGKCHILFIASSSASRLPAILDKLKGRGILTVSDIPDFAAQGGMVGFVERDRKIRFQINVDAAREGGVIISAKLLQLAQIVHSSARR